jgi:hypothetical protein
MERPGEYLQFHGGNLTALLRRTTFVCFPTFLSNVFRDIKACSSSPDIKSLLPGNESALLSRQRMPKKERREGKTDRA